MGDNGEERSEILILVDEEGNEHDFAVIDRFAVDHNEYAILVPVLYYAEDGNNGELDFAEDAFIFRVEAEEDDETLVEVEDEAEWNEVAAIWEQRLQLLEDDDEEDLS